MPTIYVIEDDDLMAECIARACRRTLTPAPTVKTFSDVLAAIQSIDADSPRLIFLDILLTGPDGFTFLNELASYQDTARIPVIIVSSLDFCGQDLSPYGVVATLDKSTMRPQDIQRLARRYLGATYVH